MDPISQWEAEDAAGDDLLSTPVVVLGFLWRHCSRHNTPVRLPFGVDVNDLDVPELLAAVLNGATEAQTLKAVVAMRDAFRLDMRDAIQTRARAIFNECNGVPA